MGAPPEISSTTFASLSQVKLLRSARSMRDTFLCTSPHLRAGQCVQLVATARRAPRSARLRASSGARLPCGCGAAAAAAPRAAAAAAGRGGRSSMWRCVAEARGSKGRGRGRYCEKLRESRLQRCGCRRRFRRTCSKVEPGSAAGCRLGGEAGPGSWGQLLSWSHLWSGERETGVTPPAKLIHGYGSASTYPRCSSRFCRGRSHCCRAAASQSARRSPARWWRAA